MNLMLIDEEAAAAEQTDSLVLTKGFQRVKSRSQITIFNLSSTYLQLIFDLSSTYPQLTLNLSSTYLQLYPQLIFNLQFIFIYLPFPPERTAVLK